MSDKKEIKNLNNLTKVDFQKKQQIESKYLFINELLVLSVLITFDTIKGIRLIESKSKLDPKIK